MMVGMNLFLLVALVTIVYSFPHTEPHGPSSLSTIELVVEDDKIEERLHSTNKAVSEFAIDKDYHTEKSVLSDMLPTWISKEHLRGHNLLHRERRQTRINAARLKRLLATKKGRKLAKKLSKKLSKKKNLPIMLALVKRKKKLRERKLKEAEKQKENALIEKQISSAVPDSPDKENNPGSNNEINLTVQVDLHDPSEQDKSIPNGKDNSISAPSLQGMHRTNPLAYPRVQVPQGPNNPFGVLPQRNSFYQRGIVPDIYRGQNREYQRSYPGLTGMLSGQEVMNNRGLQGPSFSEPGFNSNPFENYYNRPQTLNNQHVSYPENNRLSQKSPDTQNAPVSNSVRSRSNKIISDNIISPANIVQADSQLNKVIADTSSKRVDPETEKSVISSTEIKDKPEGNNEKNELENLLKDIKSLVTNLKQPPEIDAETQLTSSNKIINGNMNTHISSVSFNESTDTENNKVPPLSKEVDDEKKTEAKLESKSISSTKMKNLSQQHRQGKGNVVKDYSKKSTVDREKENENESLLKSGRKEAEPINSFKEESRKESKLVDAPELVIKDPDAIYREKLSNLASKEFIETLQNLKLISGREKKLIRRVSPNWKKNNDIHIIFKELMRRRYFRNAVNSLLEEAGMLTTNEQPEQNLIIALLKMEEQQTRNTQNNDNESENSQRRAKAKVNVNTLPMIGISSDHKIQSGNAGSGNNAFGSENLPDNIFPDQEMVNDKTFFDHENSGNILADIEQQSNYKSDRTFANKVDQAENIISEDEIQTDITSSQSKNQLNNILSTNENNPTNTFTDQEIQVDSSERVGLDDRTTDQTNQLEKISSDNEPQRGKFVESANVESNRFRINSVSNHVHQHDSMFPDHEH